MTTTTDDTFTTPAGEVTDHDPTGVQWVGATVTADPLPDELLNSCAFEEGQTHRTVLGLYEWEADDVVDGAVTHPTRDGAAVGNGLDDAWSIYALVPAQVRDDAEPRPEGDAWSDLLCALALVAGRPGNDPRNPLWCEHDTLHVSADPTMFTDAEVAQLGAWGFFVDSQGGFASFRYGSA